LIHSAGLRRASHDIVIWAAHLSSLGHLVSLPQQELTGTGAAHEMNGGMTA